jgi:phosphinothricin acetyltransferase
MIRNAAPADIESITAIYNEAILEGGFSGYLAPLPIENRRAWYAEHQGRHAIYVKAADGAVVGYVALSHYRNGRGAFSDTCEISYYLFCRYRGRGFGRDLISHAIEQARHAGFHLILAMVLDCNLRSIDLLRKFGFVISGRLPNAAKVYGKRIAHIYLSRGITS